MPEPLPTRQRLLDAGMALFAERGFTATTVGDIEAAVGLQPRRGALYKHFPSKEALLEEGARRHIETASLGAVQIQALDLGTDGLRDPAVMRPLLRAVGRWFLDELDHHRALTHVLEHDGDRFTDLKTVFRRDVNDVGNQVAADLLRAAAPGLVDPEGTAVVVLSTFVGMRRTTWTFGAPPLAIDDARAIDRWVDIVLAVIGSAS